MAQNTIAGGEGTQSIPNIEDLMKAVTAMDNKIKDGMQRTILLEKEIKTRSEERDAFKILSQKLEKENDELKSKIKLNITESQEVNIMKEKSEEILTRAKSIIFEKTKVCKNQELQIEALTQQVVSLKEVISITKDLLDIRNMEVKHLQDQINIMAQKVNVEKERQDIVHAKLDRMMSLNSDLKGEYQTQLCLFNALRQRYSEGELAKGVLPKPPEANPAETSDSENTKVKQESMPVQNCVTQTEVSIAPEPANTVEAARSGSPSKGTEQSTGEISEAESVGLSTIEENSSSSEQL